MQGATDNRLLLGIGLSHQVVVEGMWGMSFEKPGALHAGVPGLPHAAAARRDGREHGRAGHHATRSPRSTSPASTAPPVLVAALGPAMLKLAGTRRRRHHHLDDRHRHHRRATSSPTITAAAEAAGRPEPRVVVSLPVAVTATSRRRERTHQRGVLHLPEPAVLQGDAGQGGRGGGGDIAFVGDEEAVAASIARLADAGATDFVACHRR